MEKKEENKKKDIRLASTVIICRSLPDHLIDNDQFNYEILLLKRRKEARFMPNYYVFPGGLVETTDYLPITSSLFPPLSVPIFIHFIKLSFNLFKKTTLSN